jgi:hypothetical protein
MWKRGRNEKERGSKGKKKDKKGTNKWQVKESNPWVKKRGTGE